MILYDINIPPTPPIEATIIHDTPVAQIGRHTAPRNDSQTTSY